MRLMVEQACKHCGSHFLARGHDVDKGWGLFCSRSCKTQDQIEHRKANPPPSRDAVALANNLTNYTAVTETGCWIWLGAWNHAGYGTLSRKGSAHRFFYQHHKGPIPEGLLIRHKCDTPACVNPDHLEPGTHKDNSNDRIVRGRQNVRLIKLPRSSRGGPKSGFRGVTRRYQGMYRATISLNKKTAHLGYFETAQEAAHAYNRAAVKHFGDAAILNPIGEA